MQERHRNRLLYFNEQALTTERYVIPFIEEVFPLRDGLRVLEIGCGEGGNLKPFIDRGFTCMGIDINSKQIENACTFFSEHPHKDRLTLLAQDIYDWTDHPQFDLIMLRDVIEHIHNQERFMSFLTTFLAPRGMVFFGFPAWYMPFGGHQQICQSVLSKTPFIHLLPTTLYRGLLRLFKENDSTIDELLEIKQTGITLERFERIVKANNYQIMKREYWFIQPNYEVKFHLTKRAVWPVLRSIPYLRDFYTTAGYYCLTKC
ncbi:MAG: class I SAM-dependent methyltransferase [Paludibacteraceae bacterium]|nr:class I SAM-dependent methyltransferase [Paludibacteraceae bacterium]